MEKISVIMPVLHEAEGISGAIARLPSGELHEVIVVDGSPRGETLEAIGDDPVIRLISGRGRGRQMNRGASAAGGDVLLFLHADTELPPDALSLITEMMGAGFDCGAFDLGIRSERFPYRIIEWMVRLRTRFAGMPYGDQAFFVRRDFFQRLGGFREIPLMEYVDFVLRAKREGGRICTIPRRVETSPRRWEEEGILRCTLRNWGLMLLYLSGTDPEKLVRFYYRPPRGERRRG